MRKLDTERKWSKYLFLKVDNISGRKRKQRLKLFDQNDKLLQNSCDIGICWKLKHY